MDIYQIKSYYFLANISLKLTFNHDIFLKLCEWNNDANIRFYKQMVVMYKIQK